MVLKVENIDKSFSSKKVLNDINLELMEGEILGLVGPNGAGKTTLIKIILGLQRKDKGKVIINGFNIDEDFEKAIEKVGAIVESPDMYMYLSGRKNLELACNYYGLDFDRIDPVVKLVGLENRINDKVSKYSLGMRQRLGIAQALINNPNLLVIDEPTNGLDPEGIVQFRKLMKKLAKDNNIAIFVSSHNLAEIENLCDKIAIIKSGRIISVNYVKELKGDTDLYYFEIDNTDDLNIKNIDILDKRHFKVHGKKEEIAELISKLVTLNKKVYEVKKEDVRLEDVFIAKTGGNVIE